MRIERIAKGHPMGFRRRFLQYLLYRTLRPSCEIFIFCPMPQRLEDRIKELCAQAVETPASPQLDEILQQLKTALGEHTGRIRKMAAEFPAPIKRRSTDKN